MCPRATIREERVAEPGVILGAHTLAWHGHPDLSQWHQFDSDVRAVAHGRTLGEGRFFAPDGSHVVTASQVGLVRLA